MQTFLDSPTFTWIILPVLIFCARIIDMSLDTMRILMIGRGQKFYAALVGFCEVSLWLLVARQVILHLPNPLCFFAYAGGFATGNFVGMWIEEKVSDGAQMVRMVMPGDAGSLVGALRARGYGVTTIAGQGARGRVDVIYTVVMRKEVKAVVGLIENLTPGVFYTIEDVRHVNEGVFPAEKTRWLGRIFN